MNKLSVVIPAFNESQRITPTIHDVADTLRDWGQPFEILVVDDGSSDDTTAVVSSLKSSISELRVVRYAQNRGKGYAVRYGMLMATGQYRALLDADGSISASELLKISEACFGGAAIAIGSRYVDSSDVGVTQPWYRRAWSRIANKAIQRILVSGIKDTQCGAKVFEASVAQLLFGHAKTDGWAFDLEILGMARRLGLSIAEVGVCWQDDPRSRINPIRDLVNVVRETAQIRMRLRRQVRSALAVATS